ncbi:MAG: tRNA uridine(34) 5-carboxymethylaminomethyl modification radical SAM/GNAT enzyme Elp3 [Methanospirillaceae archaeon]|nr:tRNA uridine(34) 5-carboxymethylaminomethyl modification radical SAM/GNAT enzyme Elp3 [Methanospirillaceae archaeon]
MDYEAARREVIDSLIKAPHSSCNVRKIIAQVCKKYHLSSIPKQSEILRAASAAERELIREKLKVKPGRTLSGVAPVAVMTSPHPCPHGICLPCPGGPDHLFHSPQSYTGEEPAALRAARHNYDPYRQVSARLMQFEELGHLVDKAELIVMGGTITARDPGYQEWFVRECVSAMNAYRNPESVPDDKTEAVFAANETASVRCVAVTFETRPDWCRTQEIETMLALGVTKVEIGVQHTSDQILLCNRRGCTVADTVRANTLLRDAGLKVGFHVMPNLPGSTLAADRKMFQTLFSDSRFRPDFLKIYPTLVTQGSGVEELWKDGAYQTYDEDELIDLVADAKALIPEYCRLQRIQRDIPAKMILSGSRHSNFRQLAENRLRSRGGQCRCIRCREIGRRFAQGESRIQTESYTCCEGEERFISSVTGDSLIGFARLRLSEHAWPSWVLGAAFVRELHVYGTIVPIGKTGCNAGFEMQHKGHGEAVLGEAQIQARDAGYDRLAIMAGIGTRPYYRRLGYERAGPYMVRNLKDI